MRGPRQLRPLRHRGLCSPRSCVPQPVHEGAVRPAGRQVHHGRACRLSIVTMSYGRKDRMKLSNRLRRCGQGVLVGMVALLSCWGVPAFNSFFPPVHDQITNDAATDWSSCALVYLDAANRLVDLHETGLRSPDASHPSKWPHLGPNEYYVFSDHFDRGMDSAIDWRSVAQTFKDSRLVMLERIRLAREATASTVPAHVELAISFLGQALHAAQDLTSHSNLAEVDDLYRERIFNALFDPDITATLSPPPEERLRLTCYVTSEKLGKPDDCPSGFVHDHCCKDNKEMNSHSRARVPGSSQTMFDKAYALGVTVSQRVLQQWAMEPAPGNLPHAQWVAKVDAVRNFVGTPPGVCDPPGTMY